MALNLLSKQQTTKGSKMESFKVTGTSKSGKTVSRTVRARNASEAEAKMLRTVRGSYNVFAVLVN